MSNYLINTMEAKFIKLNYIYNSQKIYSFYFTYKHI